MNTAKLGDKPARNLGDKPTEKLFYGPVIYLIGKLCNFKPYVGVHHTLIENDAMRLAGLDLIMGEENDGEVAVAATDGLGTWPLKSTSSEKRDGLLRIVHFGWYHQTRHYRPDPKALCGRPIRPEIEVLQNEMWDLLGLAQKYSDVLDDPRLPAELRPLKKEAEVRIKVLEKRLSKPKRAKLKEIRTQIRELKKLHRGQWALTELGAKEAKALRAVYEGQIELSVGPNETAQYLAENWPRLYKDAVTGVGNKMPVSYALAREEDHVMNWVEKTIQRNGLKRRLDQGKGVAPSQMAGWARKAAISQIRDESRKPVCRLFHGALTPAERAEIDSRNWTEVVTPQTINESDILCHNQYATHSEDDFISDPAEGIQDTHIFSRFAETFADMDCLIQVIQRAQNIIREEFDPELDPEFHAQLVHDRFVDELDLREIANKHGMKYARCKRRIEISINRVRDVIVDLIAGARGEDVEEVGFPMDLDLLNQNVADRCSDMNNENLDSLIVQVANAEWENERYQDAYLEALVSYSKNRQPVLTVSC